MSRLKPSSGEIGHLAGLAAVAGVVALVPVVSGNAFYFHVLFMLGVNYVAAAGLNVLVGFTGQKSLGHAGLFAVGAYTAALSTADLGLGPWTALLAAPIVGGFFGLLIAVPAVRVSGPSLAMVTLGFGIIVEKIASQWSDVFGGPAGIYGIAPLTLGGHPFTDRQWVWFVIALAVLTHLLLRALLRGKYGRAFLAVQMAEPAAAAVGISIRRTKVLAFVISAVTCAIAGALVAQNNQYFNSEFVSFNLSIFLLLMVVVGGSSSVYGPLLGAVLLTLLDAGLARWPALQNLVYGLLLLFVLYALPDGIAGALAALWRRVAGPIGRPVVQAGRPPAAAVAYASSPGGVLLEATGLHKRYGGVVCLSDVDIDVSRGRIHALIGPNGAGKTTLLNVLSGHVACDSGSIRLRERDVTRAMAHQVAAAGVARTFQNLRLFTSLTVLENVLTGAHLRVKTALFASLLSWWGSSRAESDAAAQAMDLLRHLGIAERAYERAGALPYGLQRRVELARALASRPQLLLLDEPAAGLNPHEIKELSELLVDISRSGVTILLVEHHMDLVMGIADHVIVLDSGVKIAAGTPRAISENPQVIAAYLGTEVIAASDHRAGPARGPRSGAEVLAIDDLRIKYGAIEALKGVSLTVGQGEIVALIGANGAGKTTLMRAISGLVPLSGGRIAFNGLDLSTVPPHRYPQLGVAQAPEGRLVFADQSVRDNLLLGAYSRRGNGASIEVDVSRQFAMFPRLAERWHQLAGTLSGGEQQMLAIGRALMSRPKLLLLDEPSLGLAPLVVQDLFQVIRRLRDEGMTILLVEQLATAALAVADRAYVMETGRITIEGSGAALSADERVRAAYIGL